MNKTHGVGERSVAKQITLDVADAILITGSGIAASGLILRLGLDVHKTITNVSEQMIAGGIAVGSLGFVTGAFARVGLRNCLHLLRDSTLPAPADIKVTPVSQE